MHVIYKTATLIFSFNVHVHLHSLLVTHELRIIHVYVEC